MADSVLMERLFQMALGVALVLSARTGLADPALETPERTSAPQPNATEPNASQAAQDLFWEATREYQAGNYGRATELFEQLYVLVPESEVVFNIALATAKSGQCERARARFAEYTAQVSDGAVREQASARFSEVIGSCRESKAQVVADRVASAPQVAAVEPERSLKVSQSDPSASAVSTPAARDSSGTSGQQILGWVLVGAAAGVTTAGIYFETERQEARSNAEHAETSHEYEEFREDYDHARVLEMVSLGAAVGLAAVGVTLLVLDTPSDASLAFAVGMDRAGAAPFSGSVQLTGSF